MLVPRQEHCSADGVSMLQLQPSGTCFHRSSAHEQGGAWAGCGPTQAPPCCTKCNSSAINSQCTNFILFDVALLKG